jgi:hypothetical protein
VRSHRKRGLRGPSAGRRSKLGVTTAPAADTQARTARRKTLTLSVRRLRFAAVQSCLWDATSQCPNCGIPIWKHCSNEMDLNQRPDKRLVCGDNAVLGSWSGSSAIWLLPYRSGHAAFLRPVLPEGNPRHIRACAQVRVMCGTGRRKRAVRFLNSDQPMYRRRRLRQRIHVRRTSR